METCLTAHRTVQGKGLRQSKVLRFDRTSRPDRKRDQPTRSATTLEDNVGGGDYLLDHATAKRRSVKVNALLELL